MQRPAVVSLSPTGFSSCSPSLSPVRLSIQSSQENRTSERGTRAKKKKNQRNGIQELGTRANYPTARHTGKRASKSRRNEKRTTNRREMLQTRTHTHSHTGLWHRDTHTTHRHSGSPCLPLHLRVEHQLPLKQLPRRRRQAHKHTSSLILLLHHHLILVQTHKHTHTRCVRVA